MKRGTAQVKPWPVTPRIRFLLSLILLIMLIAMSAYELAKSALFPNFTILQSHLMTILFSSFVATLAAYIALRRHPSARRQVLEENADPRQAEEALKKSEEKFRELFDYAPVGYQEYDTQARITDVNLTALQILGYRREEMIGRYMWEFNVEQEIARQQIPEKIAGMRPPGHNLERTYRCKDGTTLPVLIQDRLIRDERGQITGIRCIFQDIAERKQMEETLRESEGKYRTLFEESKDMIYITAREGKLVDLNRAGMELLGYTKKELMRFNVQDTYVDSAHRLVLQKEIEQEGYVRDFETTLRTKNGTKVDCLITAVAQRAADGTILGYQGIIHNITERKRAEMEMARQKRELEILNEAKDRFLGIAAHDLRNPLTVVTTSAQVLHRLITEPNQQTLLNRIAKSCQRMLDLINSFLDSSQIMSGKLDIKLEEVHVKEFLRQCYDANDIIGKQKGILLTLSVPEGIGHARFDKERMHQVIDNLLSNAFKYSNSNTTVTLGARRSERGFEIWVEDQGVGIKEEDFPLLFKEFSKASAQPTAGEPSHGLGLAIVKRVVELQGGRIEARGTPGAGATFTITLPNRTA